MPTTLIIRTLHHSQKDICFLFMRILLCFDIVGMTRFWLSRLSKIRIEKLWNRFYMNHLIFLKSIKSKEMLNLVSNYGFDINQATMYYPPPQEPGMRGQNMSDFTSVFIIATRQGGKYMDKLLHFYENDISQLKKFKETLPVDLLPYHTDYQELDIRLERAILAAGIEGIPKPVLNSMSSVENKKKTIKI